MPAPTIATSVFRFALIVIGRMLLGVASLHGNRFRGAKANRTRPRREGQTATGAILTDGIELERANSTIGSGFGTAAH